MKNIFRASFEVCPLSLYMGDGGAEYVAKMIANPRYGRHPVQREIIDHVSLAEGEIGVVVSDTPIDVSTLPHGVKATPTKKKTPKESLRDATQNAYKNAIQNKEEKEQHRRAVIEDKTGNDAALDDLLDSMM